MRTNLAAVYVHLQGNCLSMDGDSQNTERTVEQYIRGIVNMDIGDELVANILFDRGLALDVPVSELDAKTKMLLKADVYMACANTPSVRTSVEDADGNWRHKESGGQITDADKKRWAAMANAIYAQYGENHYAPIGPRIHARGMRIWRKGYGC